MKKLSRLEMKNVMGGVTAPPVGGGGSCCSHSADWLHSDCGLSSADAQAGQYQLWCCTSCDASRKLVGAD